MHAVIVAAALAALAPQEDGPMEPGPESAAAGIGGLPGKKLPGSLADVLKDDGFFKVLNPAALTPGRSPSRNPFLLPDEQATGRSLDALRKEQLEEERRRRDAEQELEVPVSGAGPLDTVEQAYLLLDAYVAELSLTAVLISEQVRTAVIDGELIDLGEPIPGTAMVLSEVRRDGVRLSVGEHHFHKRLPPPGYGTRRADPGDSPTADPQTDPQETGEPTPGEG